MDAYDKFWQQLEENNYDKEALISLMQQSKCPYLNNNLSENHQSTNNSTKENETKKNN